MHAGKLEKSQRLQRVAKLLKDGKPHSTLDIINRAKACAISAAVSELRANGMTVDCWRSGGIWYYKHP